MRWHRIIYIPKFQMGIICRNRKGKSWSSIQSLSTYHIISYFSIPTAKEKSSFFFKYLIVLVFITFPICVFLQNLSDSFLKCVFFDSFWKLVPHIFVWPVHCEKFFLTFLTQVWDMDQAGTIYRQAHKYSSPERGEHNHTEKMIKLKPSNAHCVPCVKCTHIKVEKTRIEKY